ncbi:4-hydroxy-tetrahydrodipicolinate reductase [Candidatus Hydrogenisulfobacillus filiaventi]|uniref:4-hydroxy-tetrahydrodipicolinate reductase n=1 Tax=Candidatus Hydrogenisulfobacillus filiaventi TaxID=2707344 RepID=A0A6F8ZGB5_9FIRM|nr:4-hydroxy-tetrahydrodipicolinate reductase [Bacillota bacterium]CAB1128980.1 4-hydroxy-tetrahydrodipicolinate reductase [Candidatus Hydrogenisulfobacillus filiaventi]
MEEAEPTAVVLAGATGKTGEAVGRYLADLKDVRLVGAIAAHHGGQNLGSLWRRPELAEAPVAASLAELAPLLPAGTRPVLVDFTEPQSAAPRLLEACRLGWDLVVGTTGFSDAERAAVAREVERRGIRAVLIANFSIGAWVAERLVREAARYLKAAEIIEAHQPAKKDRPSGTARRTALLLAPLTGQAEIPVHSIRLPGMVAHQAVLFGASGQVLTIRHDVHDRSAYAPGVAAALRWIRSAAPPGVVVEDLGTILHGEMPGD